MIRLTMAGLLASSLCAQTFTINPSSGVDAVGGGTPAAPFRTMTFAVSQALGGGFPLQLDLEPGQYSAASNGEVFPLDLPADTFVNGMTECGVVIIHQAFPGSPTHALRATLNNNAEYARFRNLTFRGNQNGIRVRAFNPGTQIAELDNVRTRMVGGQGAGVGLFAFARDGAFLAVQMRNCRSLDSDRGWWLQARQNSILAAGMMGCETSWDLAPVGGSGSVLESERGSQLTVVADNCTFNRRVQAFRTNVDPLSTFAVVARHCTLNRCGLTVFVSGVGVVNTGGFVDELTPNGFVTIENSAMFNNVVELPNFDASRYSLLNNLLQTPALLGAGPGQISGDPLWVDPDAFDFHLLPGSPCLDAGTASTVAEDKDGDDRTLGCAGAPDIGSDESFATDFYVQPDPVSVNQTSQLDFRAYGTGGGVAVIATGTGVPNADCADPKLDLLQPFTVQTSVALPPGTRTSATASIPVALSSSMIGVSVDFGMAVVVVPPSGIPFTENAANLRTVVICP